MRLNFAQMLIGAVLICSVDAGLPALVWSQSVSASKTTLLNGLALSSTQDASQKKEWKAIFQYGLSSILVGRTQRGSKVGYRHVLVVIAPSNLSEREEARLRKTVPTLVANEARTLSKALDEQESLSVAFLDRTADSKQTFESTLSKLIMAVNSQFVSASNGFEKTLHERIPDFDHKINLAIAMRPCNGLTCTLGTAAFEPENRSFSRFAKLHEWMKYKGMTDVDQLYVLNSSSVPMGASLEPNALAKATYSAIHARLDNGYEWQKPLSREEMQKAFVRAALLARRTHASMSYDSADLASLSLEAAAHVADVFDSALAAGARLKSDPTIVLSGISDERARTRLRECVRLRGTFEADAAANCAGVKVNNIELAECMSGGNCMPAFGDHINPAVLLVPPGATIAELAIGGELPRINLGSIDQVKALAGACAAQHQDTGNAAFCLVKSSLGKRASDQLSCLESAAHKRGGDAEQCAVSLLPVPMQTQIACLRDKSIRGSRLAICMGLQTLPPAARELVDCFENGRAPSSNGFDALTCVHAARGSREAACLMNYRNDWEKAAICLSGRSLPPEVQAGLKCAEQSGGSAMNLGVCIVAEHGSGDTQRVAACYVEGEGQPTAIAVCLAGSRLTEDQRIVFECAAQTNGSLPAIAGCTAGRLVVKELANCRGKHFAEGSCFGENNELRKLAKRLGINIGPNSVAAKVANVQLQIVDFETRPIVDAIPTITRLYNNLPSIMKPPDYFHPTPGDALGPAGKIFEEYCKKNSCPHFPKIRL